MSEQIYKEFFEESLNQIHAEYTNSGRESDFKFWFNIEYVEDTFDSITVSVASEFMWKQMEKKGSVEELQKKINELTGQSITINYKVSSKSTAPAAAPKKSRKITDDTIEKSDSEKKQIGKFNGFADLIREAEKNQNQEQNPENQVQNVDLFGEPYVINKTKPIVKNHPQLNLDYTFDSFVPGDNSQFAYSASIAAAKNPGDRKNNPILLYGGSGLGKTHLMEAIGNYIYIQNPDAKISYIPAESLMNEFTSSIREKTIDKFQRKYRKLDVLLLDDIQFLEKSEKLQEELFYIFNEIYDRKGQLVFTCDRPLTEVKGIADRLRTRFSRGLNIDITIPDYETRKAILEKKLQLQDKEIPSDIIDYIAKNVQSNVRELEASLTKMIGYAELIGKDLTIEIAQEQLRDTFSSKMNGTITVETIQKVIASHYGITVTDLKGKKRDRKIVIPRQIAIYLARILTEYSFPELGVEFGGRDHTTAMHSYEKVADQLKTDSSLGSTLKMLEREIREYKP